MGEEEVSCRIPRNYRSLPLVREGHNAALLHLCESPGMIKNTGQKVITTLSPPLSCSFIADFPKPITCDLKVHRNVSSFVLWLAGNPIDSPRAGWHVVF